MPRDKVICAGPDLMMALNKQMGEEGTLQYLLNIAKRLDKPILANIHATNGSVTVTIPPPSWDEERTRGYLARAIPTIEAQFGKADSVESVGMSFEERLALAREMATIQAAPLEAEVEKLYSQIAEGLLAMGMHERTTQTKEASIYLVAATMGCNPCPHLQKNQPTFACLSFDRVVCKPCFGEFYGRRPPAETMDRCDICLKHGVRTFTEFQVRLQRVLVIGNGCPECMEVLHRTA
jgi:hypothetical protein